MRVCRKCWTVINSKEEEQNHLSVVDIDEEIYRLIIALNKKGYITNNCCSGHEQPFVKKGKFYILFTTPYPHGRIWVKRNGYADIYLFDMTRYVVDEFKKYIFTKGSEVLRSNPECLLMRTKDGIYLGDIRYQKDRDKYVKNIGLEKINELSKIVIEEFTRFTEEELMSVIDVATAGVIKKDRRGEYFTYNGKYKGDLSKSVICFSLDEYNKKGVTTG